jgi:hypothetical protein
MTPTIFKASEETFVLKMELFPRNNTILVLPSGNKISAVA